MTTIKKTKYVHVERYAAEVDVELVEDETYWFPYLSLEDAYRLDDVEEALRREDIETASAYGRVNEMHPVDQSN